MLTGDTVLGRGTTVVAHPDGQLGAYLGSLDRLHALAAEHGLGRDLARATDRSSTTPSGPWTSTVAHRRERLAQVEAAVARLRGDGAGDPERPPATTLPRQVVEIVYADVDPVLWGAAELSVRAQLAYLAARA